jgi:hypothetical protein
MIKKGRAATSTADSHISPNAEPYTSRTTRSTGLLDRLEGQHVVLSHRL